MAGLRLTRTERRSIAIAKQLAKALLMIETFDDDVDMIFNDTMMGVKDNKGAVDTLNVLRAHYDEETRAEAIKDE